MRAYVGSGNAAGKQSPREGWRSEHDSAHNPLQREGLLGKYAMPPWDLANRCQKRQVTGSTASVDEQWVHCKQRRATKTIDFATARQRALRLVMDLDFPYSFDSLGRTATTDSNDHVRDLIEQVLFTTPGERVM